MTRYGDKLEALLKLQDEQTRKLTVELNDLREKTGGRSSVPPASFVGLSESAAAKELIRELNQFGIREETYQKWNLTGAGLIAPQSLNLPIETIYSNTLEKDTASITVNIPSAYKHLLIFGAGRNTGTGGTAEYVLGQFNGDAGNNYDQQKISVFQTTITGEANSSQAGALIGDSTDGDSGAADAASFFSVIPNYQSSYNKNVLMMNASGYITNIIITQSIWFNRSAITTIKFLPATDSFASGFALSVLGVR